MDINEETLIGASRPLVWDMLNDPAVLKACIPGCQSLERTSEGGFAATVKLKVGPVSATMKGTVQLKNIVAPKSYTIAGEGQGGIAGFARGSCDVTLDDSVDGTVLSYAAHAEVGGKLAQLGSRLVLSTARKLAGQFFASFAALAKKRTATLEVGTTP
ncbi:SRPBCC family protein [Aliihoeflea sp. PC F10.4]